MRKDKNYLFIAYHSKGVSYHNLYWQRVNSKQGSRKTLWWEKEKVSGMLWVEVIGTGKDWAFYVIALGGIFGFLSFILNEITCILREWTHMKNAVTDWHNSHF